MLRKGLLFVFVFLSFSSLVFSLPITNSVAEYNDVKKIITFPIIITEDYDFALYILPGLGTPSYPYRIEDVHISSSVPYGIFIANTTRHFIIQDCIINSTDVAIEINNVASDTASILSNSLSHNGVGIRINSSQYVDVKSSVFNENQNGLYLESSSRSTIYSNTFTSNTVNGVIVCEDSSFNTLFENSFISNGQYGVYLSESANRNTVYRNKFIDNGLSPQAFDSGSLNHWSLNEQGNYWSENTLRKPYSIAGNSNSVDEFPLNKKLKSGTNPILTITLSSLGGLITVAAIVLFFIFREEISTKFSPIIEKRKAIRKKKKEVKKEISLIKSESSRKLEEEKIMLKEKAESLSNTEAIFIAMRMVRIRFASKNVFLSFLALLSCAAVVGFSIVVKLEEEGKFIRNEIRNVTLVLFVLGLFLAPIIVSSKDHLKEDLKLFEQRKPPTNKSIRAFISRFYFVIITLFIIAEMINVTSSSQTPREATKTAGIAVKRRKKPFSVGGSFIFLMLVFFYLALHAISFFVHLFILFTLRIQIFGKDSSLLRKYLKQEHLPDKLEFSLDYYRRMKFSVFKVKLK